MAPSRLMLKIYSRMYRLRPNESLRNIGNSYVLLQIARKLIDEAVVMAIDEFQFPDPRVFFFIFNMGGVLVETANQLPEGPQLCDMIFTQRTFQKSNFHHFWRFCRNDVFHLTCDPKEIIAEPTNMNELHTFFHRNLVGKIHAQKSWANLLQRRH